MRLQTAIIRNYRRLVDTRLDFEDETTILVGANNSGKTSATQVLDTFLNRARSFSLYDFSSTVWRAFDELGEAGTAPDLDDIPSIELDLWFHIDSADVYRVVPLLPGLHWVDAPVGIRFAFGVTDPVGLMERYVEAKGAEGDDGVQPWPNSLTDYLRRQLSTEFGFSYSVLDRSDFDDAFIQQPNARLIPLRDGKAYVASLIRFDSMNAQRHLSDSEATGRTESLSRRLSHFYKRNLAQMGANMDAHRALALSEQHLNDHFDDVFKDTLAQLGKIGYPGVDEPKLVVRSELDTKVLFNEQATVHYALQDHGGNGGIASLLTLPDRYNGLGYKNLIYMVVELLDYELSWQRTEGLRPLLHLISIEEPEAHLHAQLQQVFIKTMRELLTEDAGFTCQTVVTTHSSHIVYHSGFAAVRYFKRVRTGANTGSTDVRNLTDFEADSGETLRFIRQYMKLTHCDLLFADAAILVEGNVERLLLPMVIDQHVPHLKNAYLSVLELGGAFAHKFADFIDFLEIPTLVITDLDSVYPPYPDGIDDDEKATLPRPGKTCVASTPGSVTANQSLATWLPALRSVDELLAADDDACEIKPSDGARGARVRVAYQRPIKVAWGGEEGDHSGRTLEEAFALTNLAWTQDVAQKALKLRIPKNAEKSLEQIVESIHKKVSSKSFDKTSFALALFMVEEGWDPPAYIRDGLQWLCNIVVPAVLAAGVLEDPDPTANGDAS